MQMNVFKYDTLNWDILFADVSLYECHANFETQQHFWYVCKKLASDMEGLQDFKHNHDLTDSIYYTPSYEQWI